MFTPKTGHNTGRETGKQENENTPFSQGSTKELYKRIPSRRLVQPAPHMQNYAHDTVLCCPMEYLKSQNIFNPLPGKANTQCYSHYHHL